MPRQPKHQTRKDSTMTITTFKDSVKYASQQVISGHSWLKVHAMQGGELVQVSKPKEHFLAIKNQRVTEVFQSEIALAQAVKEVHGLTFQGLTCTGSNMLEGDTHTFTWRIA